MPETCNPACRRIDPPASRYERDVRIVDSSEIHRHLLAWREEQPTTGVAGEKEDARERLLPWR
jgi:hypothetical protein